MNVYLIEDDGGVTMFDAGISDMAPRSRPLARASAASSASSSAMPMPIIAAPRRVSVHPSTAIRPSARPPSRAPPLRDYWDLSKLGPHGRLLLGRLLPVWDGGAV